MGSMVEELEGVSCLSVDVPSEVVLLGGGGEKVNSSSSSLSGKWRKKKNGGVEAGSGSGGANNLTNSTRRIFSPAFKQTVLEAYVSDPQCTGNQRATARKFGIHRRQVQKWLTQIDKVSKLP
jgi:hypothetical protein